MISQQLIKDAVSQRLAIDKGIINIPAIKSLLQRVEGLSQPRAEKKRRDRVAEELMLLDLRDSKRRK